MKGTYTQRNRKDIGRPPMCAGCSHLVACDKQKMACGQYEKWQRDGGRAWAKLEREPSEDIYNRIFNKRIAA